MNVSIFGYAAAVLTSVSFLPQAIKVYKTKHTKDLSLAMYLIFTGGVILWLAYGVMIDSRPIILANSITLLLNIYILTCKVVYK